MRREWIITLNILNMVHAKNYKNKDEVIADFKKAFARKREWLEQAERELAEICYWKTMNRTTSAQI